MGSDLMLGIPAAPGVVAVTIALMNSVIVLAGDNQFGVGVPGNLTSTIDQRLFAVSRHERTLPAFSLGSPFLLRGIIFCANRFIPIWRVATSAAAARGRVLAATTCTCTLVYTAWCCGFSPPRVASCLEQIFLGYYITADLEHQLKEAQLR
jgi:hypothetical protein